MSQHRPTRFTWLGVAWLLLPVAAWFVGILWLGGDLGRGTDDYSVNFRDPATGAIPSPFNPWARYPFFWRPLHNAMCFGLGTVFAENWRILMIFCAVMHGSACLAVYSLLRAATRSRGPAAVGALALLLHPMNFEVAFWFCSISAAIATALWCVLALWCARLVRRPRGPRLRELLGIAAIALVIPCFYEQPATGVLALPLVLLALWLRSREGPRLVAAFGRAVLLSGIAGLMDFVYIALLRTTAPSTFRGGSDSFVAPDRIGNRIAEVTRSIRWQLQGRRLDHTARGAWETGIEALATPVGIAAIGMLLVLAVVWAWAWWSEQPADATVAQSGESDGASPSQPRATAAAARASWIIAGLVLFVGAFIPIALMGRQNVEPRTLYFPMVGLCIVFAHVLDVLLSLLPRTGFAAIFSRVARASVALAVAAAVIAGCICCVGIQSWCHQRSKRDEATALRLAELIPDPPAHAVYIPLALDDGITQTGYLLFDRLRPSAFGTTWSATALMQQRTRRADVVAAAINPWAKYPFDRFSAEGLWYALKLDGRASDAASSGDFITWDRAIPFTVDTDGRVRLVRQIEITRSDDRIDTFSVPAVRAAIRAGTARGHAAPITLTDSADPPPSFVAGWRWVDPESGTAEAEINMQRLTSRGISRDGVWLHPTYQNSSRAAMQAILEPSPNPRSIRFRLTTSPEDFARFAGAIPVTIHFELVTSDAPESPISSAQLELTQQLADAQPLWPAIEVPIPCLDSALLLRIRAASTQSAPPPGPHAPVWVTPGIWISSESDSVTVEQPAHTLPIAR